MLAAYALPALPLAMLTLPFYVVVPAFYARTLGLPIAAVGGALLIVRLVDAVSDPLVGYLADRWRPAFGRRRLWTLAASFPTAFAAYQIFAPPNDATLQHLTFWGILLSVFWTSVLVPYTAWGAELSTSYAGRTRIAAWREMFAVVGTLVALVVQAAALWAGQSERFALLTTGLLIGFGLPIAALMTVSATPEPFDATQKRLPVRDGFALMASNAPFVRLLFAFFLNGCANGFPATLFLFFVSEKLQAETWAGPLLVIYFLCGVLGVPLWLKMAQQTSKHRAWCVAMIGACAFFAIAPFLQAGDAHWFALVCIGTGLALGADVMLPPAIQADVIDVDTAASGEQRAGLYFAMWSLTTKLALALAVGVAFPVLALWGFDPAANLRTNSGLAMLGFLYAGAPVLLKLASIALMWNFPLDAAAQAQLRATIDARQKS